MKQQIIQIELLIKIIQVLLPVVLILILVHNLMIVSLKK
jgi:hypothetical protein